MRLNLHQHTISCSRACARRLSGYFTVLAALLLALVAPSAFAQCGVVYTISPQNNAAFGAAITLNNTGTTAWTSWTLTWTFANGQTISSLWNGNETQSGSNVTVTNQSYNGSVPAGGSVTGMGFNGTWNGSTNAVPTNFAVNGVACNGGSINPGSFTLAGGAVSVKQGATATDAVTVTDINGFTGTVALAVSGLPAGVTGTFSGTTLTLTASATATVGTSTATITGSSGNLTETATFAVTVTSSGGGTCTPTAITPYLQVNGAAWQETNVATVTAITATVNLGPQPTTGTWAWVGPNGFTSTARQINAIKLVAGANVYTATYTNAAKCASTEVFTITAPGGGSLTLTPASTGVNVAEGASVTDAITATGATGTVTYTAKATGTGVTATIAGGVLTVTASATAPTGASTVTVTGSSGTLTASTVITVNVTTTGGGSLTLTPASASVTVAQGASVTDVITPSGGNETVITYTATATGAGVTANVANGVLTISASATATVGSSTVTVTGTSGTLSASTVITVNVTKTGGGSPGSFTISSSLSLISIVAGSTATDTVIVSPVNGFTGSVSLAIAGLPSGVTSSWSVNPASTSSTLTLTASNTTALGNYNVSITGIYGALSQTVGLELSVTNATASSFTLSASSATVSAQQNSGVSEIITVHDLNGFSGSVGFNISGLPSGVTPNFNPSTTSTNTLLAIAVGSSVTPGSYPLTIEGSSGNFAAGVNVTLNVSAGSPLKIAWVSPISATAGTTVTVLPGGSGDSFGAAQGTSAIYFGSTAATVTSWAVNSIQVTVPTLAAGTVNVTAVVNGVTSNAVPFVITAATPSPTVYNGNATHFGGTGNNAGGCGVPGNIQDTQNYVALNVQNDPGNYSLNLARPIVAPYLGDIGVWNNGLNCGRYLHVQIGNACEGTNDGTADETFCRDGADWIADQFNGAELDMVVQDSCQDGNSWCRDDPYHLDLNQNVIDDFLLNGTAVGDLFENWSNRQLIWYFEEAPNYTGDINIYVNQSSGPYATQVILTHLLNGLHGVNYYSNGAWKTGTMVSDNGSVYIILPTVTAGNQYQIQVYDVDGQLINNGRIYSFSLPSSCGTSCGSVTQVTYTTSSAN